MNIYFIIHQGMVHVSPILPLKIQFKGSIHWNLFFFFFSACFWVGQVRVCPRQNMTVLHSGRGIALVTRND